MSDKKLKIHHPDFLCNVSGWRQLLKKAEKMPQITCSHCLAIHNRVVTRKKMEAKNGRIKQETI